ncbi:MAG: hypothetical protein ACFB9N_18145 [Geitlerinemataceae cyanobacterium]
MTERQGNKVLALAEHLLENGANPANLMMVIPAKSDPNFFVVLDGNRRLNALKLLESPQLAEGTLSEKDLRKLKKLSRDFESSPIQKFSCVVFDSRDEADVWISLTHRGLNKGAGMLPWDAQVGARYDERRKGKKEIALRILDFVKKSGNLSEIANDKIEEGKFPITTLDRMLSTPYVREKLGISKDGSEITLLFPEEQVLKGLNQIVEDLASGEKNVSDLKRANDRIDYINDENFIDILPDQSLKLPNPIPLTKDRLDKQVPDSTLPLSNTPSQKKVENPTTNEKSDSQQGSNFKPKSRTFQQARKTLIPRGLSLAINQARVNNLFRELKQLNLEVSPNSGAVMLRVFIELSVDHFVEEVIKWDERKTDNSKLKDKLSKVAQYLEDNKAMTKNELAPIRKFATGDGMLAASVKSMNQYVHNRYYSPVPSELIVVWDDFQLFIQKIWEIAK